MRILHVLTLITPDGAYGGPARVALNQASTLRDQGHDVVIAAGCAGFEDIPTELEGVPVELFPARRLIERFGYAPTYVREMRGWLAGNIRHFDVSHIHLARDLVTAPAAVRIRNARLPFVVQTHGMVIRSSHPLAGSFDRIWTTRILRSAADVLYLTAHERSQLELIGGSSINLTHLPNGIPDISVNGMAPRRGGDELPEVLFFARLHPRKRPSLFAEAAVLLLRSGVQASFVVAGPPEGAEALVDSVIEAARLDGFGESVLRREVGVPLDGAYSRLSAASIYVLPSLMEPFGMTIVEALAVGVPVVVSNDGGLASFVRRHRCGLTVDATIDDLVDAISELLGDLPQASEMGRRGQQGVRDEFNISEIGKSLDRIYQRALEKRRDQA